MTEMTMLVVDDNPANLLLMTRYAQSVGNVLVRSAASPVEALEWCSGNEVDLIVTDFVMPGMDGLEFLRRLRAVESTAEVPVVMVTGHTVREFRREALVRGVTDFLAKPIDRIEFMARCRNLLELRASHKRLKEQAAGELIMRLSRSIESRDSETGAHLDRMARYSRVIAAGLGLSESMQERIQMAAPMHDVGKVAVADEILFKPGRYTAEEYEIMKLHTVHGYRILEDSSSPLIRLAASIALSHHERFDGTGYPRGLKGEDIPLPGRIIAVADVFDALTSPRPYKNAWSVEDAVSFMRDATGTQFDPSCMGAFIERLPEILQIRQQFTD